jgi:hypothetical protein
MAFGIDVKGMTAKLEERFGQLLSELQNMHATLRSIHEELKLLRAQKGPQ